MKIGIFELTDGDKISLAALLRVLGTKYEASIEREKGLDMSRILESPYKEKKIGYEGLFVEICQLSRI